MLWRRHLPDWLCNGGLVSEGRGREGFNRNRNITLNGQDSATLVYNNLWPTMDMGRVVKIFRKFLSRLCSCPPCPPSCRDNFNVNVGIPLIPAGQIVRVLPTIYDETKSNIFHFLHRNRPTQVEASSLLTKSDKYKN